MLRPEVVAYLRENLGKFPVEALKAQLLAEGVPEADLQESLAAALKAPKPGRGASLGRIGRALKLSAAAGLLLLVAVVVIALTRSTKGPEEPAAPVSAGEGAHIGRRGWVVRLPKDYTALTDPAGAKAEEIVHFCRRGTDPTNFLNEGLFAQLGIVRLTVMPSPFPANPTGLANLSRAVSARLNSRGEKYALKNMQAATLQGLQVDVQSPFPRVEAYILGQKDLYVFFAGEDNEVYRDIVLSLRDVRTEN